MADTGQAPGGHWAGTVLFPVDPLESDPRLHREHQGIIHQVTDNPDLKGHSHIIYTYARLNVGIQGTHIHICIYIYIYI